MSGFREQLNAIDWNGEKAEQKRSLAEGIYFGKVLDYKFGTSTKKITPFFELEIVINKPEIYAGSKVFKTYYMTPKTMPFLARNLLDWGFPIQSAGEILDINFTGMNVKFKMANELNKEDGNDYLKCAWVNKIEEQPTTTTTEAQKKEDSIPF